MDGETLVAVIVGVLQGIFEWLPVSSEGNLSIALAALGSSPAAAVQLALFAHVGTALSATVYYRAEILEALLDALDWRPATAWEGKSATTTFLVATTTISGVVALAAYLTLKSMVSELSAGLLVAAIGGLLVATGLVQRFAERAAIETRSTPDAVDVVLVGVLQGLAILPGVSRSGTTVSALLLRGHEGETALRYSFLLSVPVQVGAGVLVVAEVGGLPMAPVPTLVAVGVGAVVGYLTIDALMRVVRRIAFWAVCVALGSLAVIGGVLVALG
ncbi:UDP-diphosphatase [Halobacteriales archaeon QS_1_68_20]|nr:MAG: UDP-diphosphatase [Halobacteriales archaeon QS_1_68_20]